MSNITIFTDGSSRGNPGPGGWGAVVVEEQEAGSTKKGEPHVTELGGGEKHTTNNRMEIMAAVGGLEKVSKSSSLSMGHSITIYSDSSYVINGITKWIKGWKKNGWKTKTKDDVLNRDIWENLHDLTEKISHEAKISWKYVGGHVGILGNERCDEIATAFADQNEIKLYDGPISGYNLPNILDISLDESKVAEKSATRSRSNSPAYSYISAIGGVIEVHKTWSECEKRVKGAKGARYKKALSVGEEAAIISEFEAL